jgi:hypothetical protein
VNTLKNLTVANIEEFTDDFVYDHKRDTMLVTVEELYSKEIRKIMFNMEYELVLHDYDAENDKVTFVFTRFI